MAAGGDEDGGAPVAPVVDPAPPTPAAPAATAPTRLVFCCRKCRCPLFRDELVEEVGVGRGGVCAECACVGTSEPANIAPRILQGLGVTATDETDDGHGPNTYFLSAPTKWMESASKELEAKLYCPECNARVGSLNWVGFALPSGKWVCPAIQIAKKAVDPRKDTS
jgi:dual specificity phosphatase 12